MRKKQQYLYSNRMGKSKTSRKGKKEWRKNIGTQELDLLVEKTALDERSGGALDALPSESLFFVDKTKDVTVARKVHKHRSKILQADSILQRNTLIPVLKEPGHSHKKRKDRDVAKPLSKVSSMPPKSTASAAARKIVMDSKSSVFDMWGEGGDEMISEKTLEKKKYDAKRVRVEAAPAVVVDEPGCSYNPTFVDHQEVLGLAVAEEMQKVLKKDLEPDPIPTAVVGGGAVVVDEEDMFFIDADYEDDANEEKIEEEDVTVTSSASNLKSAKYKKLTKAELNRKARRKGVLKAEAERLKKLKLQKDVQRLPQIMDLIQEEDLEKERRRIRRNVSKEEKRAQGPPRLGKHKFKPEPVQVLLTEEVTGSLRKLKGYPLLVRDRFKSLQRRGILEPRMPTQKKTKRRRVVYEQGSRGQKEREMHAAMLAEKEAKKQGLAVVPLQ